MADIVLVNPRFETSYWGLEYALPILHKRAAMPEADLRAEYRKGLRRLLRLRRDPAMAAGYLLTCCMHYHHWTMARQMARGEIPVINTY